MAQQSMRSPEQELNTKLAGLDRTNKQLKAAVTTIGNLDERLTTLESLVMSMGTKQQEDIRSAWNEINKLNGNEDASKKFDMESTVATHPHENAAGAPPVG
jgi:hypothetical protein